MKMDIVTESEQSQITGSDSQPQQHKRSAADLIGSNIALNGNDNNKYQCLHLVKNNNTLNITNKQYKSNLPKYTKGISEENFTKQILEYLDIDPKFALEDIENVAKIESVKIREGVYMNILSKQLDYSVLKNWIEEALKNSQWRVVAMLVVLSNSVSSFLVPSLISSLVGAKKEGLLVACLRTMNDLSVGDLLLIVKYCLESIDTRSTLLDWALVCRYTRSQMVGEIRSLLSIEQCSRLIEYLMAQLKRYADMEDITCKDNEIVLTMNQLVEWTSILLDSHFQEWIRIPEFLQPYSELIQGLQFESKLIGRSKAFIQSKLDSEQSIDANYSIHYYDL